jgi:hypothetical protein
MLLDAARFMDSNECQTIIAAARESAGLPLEEVVAHLGVARGKFAENAKAKFKRQ